MKLTRTLQWLSRACVGLALAAGIQAFAVTDYSAFNHYSTSADTDGMWYTWWGNGVANWDGTQDHTGDGGGSLYITEDYGAGNQYMVAQDFNNTGAWNNSVTIDCTLYTNIQFYIKWDATKSLTITSFNNSGDNFTMALIDSGWGQHWISGAQVPIAASNGWVQMNIPINTATPGISQIAGLAWKNYWGVGSGTIGFWVDDILLQANAAPPPPPTLSETPIIPGLNLISTGTGHAYDRYGIRKSNGGAGFANADGSSLGHSVHYQFTVAANPPPGYQLKNYLVPGTPASGDAPDWNESNVIMMELDLNTGGGFWLFRWKTNAPNANGSFYDGTVIPGTLGDTVNIGTWDLAFNPLGGTNYSVTMTGPSGVSTNFNLSPDIAQYFFGDMYYYITGLPGTAANYGGSVAVSDVKLTGVSGGDFEQNFITNPTLDTTTPVWDFASIDSANTPQVFDGNYRYWVKWTQPDTGFVLQQGTSVAGLGNWTDNTNAPFNLGPDRAVTYTKTNEPSADIGFFRLLKRPFVKMLVLLPGETYDPTVQTGKTGTPTPVPNGTQVTVTVLAVDSTWKRNLASTDTIHLTTTDTAATPSPIPDTPMFQGSATFNVTMGTVGTQTFTASDVTDATKTPVTSAGLEVQ